MNNQDLEKLQEELKWIQVREVQNNSILEKLRAKGILGFLVPAGCLITSGVLCRGVYFMFKKDSRAQQKMMRYRIGAQGVTIALAMISVLLIPVLESK